MYCIFLSYNELDLNTHTHTHAQFRHSRERGTIHEKEVHWEEQQDAKEDEGDVNVNRDMSAGRYDGPHHFV